MQYEYKVFTEGNYDNKDIIEGVQNGIITSESLGFEDYPCEETMKRWINQFAK